jgi:MoaA/NifB/PqqE/SkfB family radical SAM enzyme
VSATIEANKRGIREQCSERALVVDHLPYYYGIHLAMPCNQRCIMCVPNFQHAQDVLPFEEFVAFFDQVKDYAEHITLIGGETFMYPRIADVLDLLSGHPIEVTITTNAFMLNERVIPGLLGLHELNLKCSIDAATPATYKRIRGRDHFDQATGQMRRFAKLVADKPHLRMMVNYVVMRENLDEVLPFIDLARSLGVERIDYMPVSNVATWHVENGTGWTFDGQEQSCQFFADEYNDMMSRASARCEEVGVGCEVIPI